MTLKVDLSLKEIDFNHYQIFVKEGINLEP
jgi:hypothetical protein